VKLTNERDVDVDSRLRVPHSSSADRDVMRHFPTPRDRFPQRLVAFPRLLTEMLDLKPATFLLITSLYEYSVVLS